MVNTIKELAKRKKTNIAQLERSLGLSQGSIRNWDEKPPSYDKVEKVANYFGITIDELIDNNSLRSIDEITLLANYKEADKRGKETISNVAELEARRSRKEKTEARSKEEEPLTAQKIQFPKREENNELKPFA